MLLFLLLLIIVLFVDVDELRISLDEFEYVLFTEDIDPCRRGYVLHREGSGLFTLRGIVNNPSACSAKYKVSFGANIAIAAGGTAGPISLALAIDGEPIPTS